MLIPSPMEVCRGYASSLSRRVNANSQQNEWDILTNIKLIKKGEC